MKGSPVGKVSQASDELRRVQAALRECDDRRDFRPMILAASDASIAPPESPVARFGSAYFAICSAHRTYFYICKAHPAGKLASGTWGAARIRGVRLMTGALPSFDLFALQNLLARATFITIAFVC